MQETARIAAASPFRLPGMVEQVAQVVENTLDFPEELAYLWDRYVDLSSRRSYEQGNAQPLSWPEIDSYFRLRKEQPTEWELNLIMRLDVTELTGAGE